ncbi:MAG: HD domain-containing protein [Deltaproteobacteria bacterium]|nr:HD domain-containing protein [Deltaproteobacteria bacterium]
MAIAVDAAQEGMLEVVRFPVARRSLMWAVHRALHQKILTDRNRLLESEILLYKDRLEKAVRFRTAELSKNQVRLERTLEATIQAMALAVEARDPFTAGHQRRVAHLATSIACCLGFKKDSREMIKTAGSVHDLGKIAVPSEILTKPGRLSEAEFGLIRTHAERGWEILLPVEFPWPVAEVVRQHHECLDGSGYPRGLVGADILPEARVLAVADVTEAILSHRPYRAALGYEAARCALMSGRGRRYDADAVDACIQLLDNGYVFPEPDPMQRMPMMECKPKSNLVAYGFSGGKYS